ncbi:MAG TPA: phosphate signaling complex protein PhoU, partial [Alphaproteobacteria bacterium]|nr:phosphate signaling complex protein PhoU [Alphaproteobacteria bacterium]
MSEHIVKAFEHELDKLKRTIVQMGGVAESQFETAIRCVVRRDGALATQVIQNDVRLDEYESEIGEDVVRLLALRQPMAGDLREVISSLKIAADLERIGDYAANVAKRSLALAQVPPVKPATTIPRMGRLVQEIIKDVLDGYTERDLDRALAAWHRDEEVDDLYT